MEGKEGESKVSVITFVEGKATQDSRDNEQVWLPTSRPHLGKSFCLGMPRPSAPPSKVPYLRYGKVINNSANVPHIVQGCTIEIYRFSFPFPFSSPFFLSFFFFPFSVEEVH